MLDQPQIKPSIGRWVTRSGKDAVVLCDDAPGSFPFIGYIINWHRFPDGSPAFAGSKPMAWNQLGLAREDTGRTNELIRLCDQSPARPHIKMKRAR